MPTAISLQILAQKFLSEMSMCISTAQARTHNVGTDFGSYEGLVLLMRRFVFQLCSFCVADAGHRTLFHPRGRRGIFRMFVKRPQAWFK